MVGKNGQGGLTVVGGILGAAATAAAKRCCRSCSRQAMPMACLGARPSGLRRQSRRLDASLCLIGKTTYEGLPEPIWEQCPWRGRDKGVVKPAGVTTGETAAVAAA